MLDRDRRKAERQLSRAKTKRAKSRAQEKVDRLAKADPVVYARANSISNRINNAMNTIGMLYLSDQIFYGGRGTRAAKNAVKAMGMLTISAVAKARGATDIHWYDKYGRKIV